MFANIPDEVLLPEDRIRFQKWNEQKRREALGHTAEDAHHTFDASTSGSTTEQKSSTEQQPRGRHPSSDRRSAACAMAAEMLRRAKAELKLSETAIGAAIDLDQQRTHKILKDELPFEVGHLLMYLDSSMPDVALPIKVITSIAERMGEAGTMLLIEELLRLLSDAGRVRMVRSSKQIVDAIGCGFMGQGPGGGL